MPDSKSLDIQVRVPPKYPDEARAEYLQGRVLVKVQISETGDVESAEILSGPFSGRRTVLDEAALDAARQWKFKPFIRNGKPVKVTTTLPFDFNLEGQVPDWGARDLTPIRPDLAGRSVTPGKLIHRVEPTYPLIASQRGLSGSVVLNGTIGRDGRIQFLHVVQGNPMLAQAAIDAVKKWKYTPYMINGEPVDVNMQITVNFVPSR